MKGILEKQWNRKKSYVIKWKLSEFTYFGDRMSADGGCEAAVTARTRCGWVKFRECNELLHCSRFPLRLKGAVYKSYVKPAILYESEAWCLKESEMGILRGTKISKVSPMCGVQLKDRKILQILY